MMDMITMAATSPLDRAFTRIVNRMMTVKMIRIRIMGIPEEA